MLRKVHAVRPNRRPHRLMDAVTLPDRAIGESDFTADRHPTFGFAARIDRGEHFVGARDIKRRISAGDGPKRAGVVLTLDERVGKFGRGRESALRVCHLSVTCSLPEQAQRLAEHDAAGEYQRREHHRHHRGRNRAAHTVPADRRNDEPRGSRANAGADDDGDSTEDVRHTFRDGVVSSEPGPVRLSEWGARARKSAPPATRNISFYAWRAKSRLADVSRRKYN